MAKLTKNQKRKKKLQNRNLHEAVDFSIRFAQERRAAHRRMITNYGEEYYRKLFGTKVLDA